MKFKIDSKLANFDFFKEDSLLNKPTENVKSLGLSKKKERCALSRQGLGILTSRASLWGTYLAVLLSVIMLCVYHHLSAFLGVFAALGAVASRVYMMRYFAEYGRADKNFGKKHKYAIYASVEIAVNMLWLILLSLCSGINLIGYFIALAFCMMSVISGFAQLIYFVKMNDIETTIA